MGCRAVYGLPLLSRPSIPASVEIGHSVMSLKQSHPRLKVFFLVGRGVFAWWVRQLLANLKGLQTYRSYSQPASTEDSSKEPQFPEQREKA